MNENTGYTDSISFYLALHMIDDRMALDQVEFYVFYQQRHQRAFLSYPVSSEARVERERVVERWGLICGQSSATPPFPFGIVLYLGNGATGSPQSSPFLAVPKKVNALYFEKFQKSMYRSLVTKIHGCMVPTSPLLVLKNGPKSSLWG
ncbi:hypothetical protein GOODEAATRI_031181 [Goodea atripinnis]|uniref:Maturase n=1 Tax=Goodea atripinnis TaxID=208336 RepID=A0ABV0MWU7_9TELE